MRELRQNRIISCAALSLSAKNPGNFAAVTVRKHVYALSYRGRDIATATIMRYVTADFLGKTRNMRAKISL